MKRVIYIIAFLSFSIVSVYSQWIIQSSPTSTDIVKVKFVNQNTGFMINNFWNRPQVIYKTTNSGNSWDSTIIGDAVNEIYFLNEDTGWLTGRTSGDPGIGKVWKTTNAGVNWISQLLSDSLNGYSISFPEVNTGFMTVNKYDIGSPRIYKTTNSGINWFSIPNVLQNYRYVFGASFINSSTGWLLTHIDYGADSSRSFVLKTTNGGINWTQYMFNNYFGDKHSNIHSIVFFDQSTGYASGNINVWYNGGIPRPLIFKTTDGGNSWSLISIPYILPEINYVTAMYFENPESGWIAGNNGRIAVTKNGGVNWIFQQTGLPVGNDLLDINFESGNGWAVSDRGTILKTTNGGFPPQFIITGTVKYQDNNQPVSRGYVKAFKHSALGGDVVLHDSVRIQSNGTYTLTRIPQDTIDLMAFDDDEALYSPGFVPTYYPSTIYWEQAEHLYPTSNLNGIDVGVYRITNDMQSSGRVSGGVFLNTDMPTSGIKDAFLYAKVGNLFRGYSVSLNTGSYRIDSLPQGTYQIICNRMGYPTKTRTEILGSVNLTEINFYYGILTGIPNPEIPIIFSLSQNYPNPFNPVTKISFEIPKAADVQLKIYDALGREVTLLVNGNLNAGFYSADWDAVNYPSGVYFYKLTAGDFSETKKMVLLK